ncbi:U11/U12 small nuclear ribonucleoprotein 35 kDa protein-like [Mizuhopecten yessoensis]|uniref:U11/U12 small nuclear ribonucleoprotein 35 kDa protein n=1 Tax=Mizuhopecten yessoensis TaxID=6573 RepID=A0A210QZ03_MIZYE|nr:U11/U12 small nuclear ribonucleoprotein 35 kDa protein-like [Mizuhopecten yessoensis]OWF53970.1 U11/U12 small nuclear ribonucleoprotein 35 kDa protein [Mizuhopecten yessoensis]
MERDRWSPIATTYDPLRAGSIDTTDRDPHDRGIVKAMNAKYRPNKDVVGSPEKTVFIARLNPKTTEDTVESKFSKYGDIERLRLVRDLVTGCSRCYAFVEYQNEKSAYRATKEADKIELDGCEIFVDFECERKLKGWIPRRLGGGLGGKKESGQLRFGGKDRPFRKPLDLENRFRSDHSLRDRTRFQDDSRSRSEYGQDGRRQGRFEKVFSDRSSTGKYQEARERQRHSGKDYSDSSQSGRSREDRDSYRDYSEGRDRSVVGRSRGDRDRYRCSDGDYSVTRDRSPASVSSRDRRRESDHGDNHRSHHRRSRSGSRDR